MEFKAFYEGREIARGKSVMQCSSRAVANAQRQRLPANYFWVSIFKKSCSGAKIEIKKDGETVQTVIA